MKKTTLVLSLLFLAVAVGLALNDAQGITGQASYPFRFEKSVQVGVVLVAALGILGITLINLTHKE